MAKKSRSSTLKFHDVLKNIKDKKVIANYEGDLYLLDQSYLYYKKIENPLEVINNLIDLEYRDVVSPSIVEQVVKKLKMDNTISLNENILNPEDYINTLGGVLHVPTLTLYEKNISLWQFTYMINANYLDKEEIKNTEKNNFLHFLETSFENDKQQRELFLKAMGYMLSNYTQSRKMFFFIGPTACGKSIACKILHELVGRENITNLSLQEIGSKFNLHFLNGIKLNISSELNGDQIPYSGVIKSLVSNDYIYADIKFETGIFFKPTCKILQVCNLLPSLKNDTDGEGAFRDRVILVKFPKKIEYEDRDPELFNKLKLELDFIFTICINKFKKNVYDNNFIFEMPEESIKLLNTYCISAKEKVTSFIKDDCLLRKGEKEHTYILYSNFLNFCEQNFLEPCTQVEFTNIMISLEKEFGFHKKKFRKNGKNRIGFENISLNIEKNYRES